MHKSWTPKSVEQLINNSDTSAMLNIRVLISQSIGFHRNTLPNSLESTAFTFFISSDFFHFVLSFFFFFLWTVKLGSKTSIAKSQWGLNIWFLSHCCAEDVNREKQHEEFLWSGILGINIDVSHNRSATSCDQRHVINKARCNEGEISGRQDWC